jgi:hypothetical protein
MMGEQLSRQDRLHSEFGRGGGADGRLLLRSDCICDLSLLRGDLSP